MSELTSEQDYVKEELESLRACAANMKQELEDIWKDDHEAVYELTSVFIHRGSTPQWGHYFFYSRHLPENPDSWFKYNDSEVSVVSKDEVFADSTGLTANPYMVRSFCSVTLMSLNVLIVVKTTPARFCPERVGHDQHRKALRSHVPGRDLTLVVLDSL